MNQGSPSPGIGLTAPDDPRLAPRQHTIPPGVNLSKQQTTTTPRIISPPVTQSTSVTVIQGPSRISSSHSFKIVIGEGKNDSNSNKNNNSSNNNVSNDAETTSPVNAALKSPPPPPILDTSSVRAAGSFIKMKSRPKKNDRLVTNGATVHPPQQTTACNHPQQQTLPENKKIKPINSFISHQQQPSTPIPTTAINYSSTDSRNDLADPKLTQASTPAGPVRGDNNTPMTEQLPFGLVRRSQITTVTRQSPTKNDITFVQNTSSQSQQQASQQAPSSTATKEQKPATASTAHNKTNSGPKKEGTAYQNNQHPTPHKVTASVVTAPKMTNSASPLKSLPPFSWTIYLERTSSEAAPKEAFMQSQLPIQNTFKVGMKLEAKDPRNTSSWCLATILSLEGLRLRLRFDGSDSMNDFFELVDSENIRAVGSKPDEILYPPMAYKGNLSGYPKFLEKVLTKPDTLVAPRECFVPPPKRPDVNLFRAGMKLEAVDRKNPYLICPATVGEVNGADLKIIFDGWRGSFDYSCPYFSRDIFPANWCNETYHYITPPNGWGAIFNSSKQVEDKVSRSPNTRGNRVVPVPAKAAKKMVTIPPAPPKQLGRPRLSHSTPQVNKVAQPTPKKDRKKQSPPTAVAPVTVSTQPESPPVDNVEYNNNDDDDLGDIPDAEKYICQRVLPISEWRETKNKAVGVTDTTSSQNSVVVDINCSEAEPKPTLTSNETPSSEIKEMDTSENPSSSAVNGSEVSSPGTTLSRSTCSGNEEIGNSCKRMKVNDQVQYINRYSIASYPKSYRDWTVKNVLDLVNADDTLAKYSGIFEEHEIDGKAFVLLTMDIMKAHMGMKVGPALKIIDLIDQLKRLK